MRAFGYVRVSEAREGGISPEIQQDEITRYCVGKGWTLLEWFQDLDISGRTDKRPALQDMIRRAQDGETDVVVFYRIDRLSREPAHHYAILGALREAGVLVDSVGQPADGTAEGEFMWDLSAALAKLESLRLGRRIRDAHRRIAATGRYHGGPAPYGMRRDPAAPGLIAHPEEAPWVLRIHEWYQRGWSGRAIARELNRQAIPSKGGTPWVEVKVRNILASPYHAGGRLVNGEFVRGDNVVPIIPTETWENTQALRRARSVKREGGRTPDNGLRGRMVRCGNCGAAMSIHYKASGRMIYRCEGKGRGTCPHGAAISGHILEPIVQQRLIVRLRGSRVPRVPDAVPDGLRVLREELNALRASLVRLATAYAEGAMGKIEYAGARAKLMEKQTRAERQLSKRAAKTSSRVAREAAAVIWEDLGRITVGMIAGLPPAKRRELYELLIERIVVHPMGQEPRVRVAFRW